MPAVDVILPVLDESEALPGVLELMPAGYRPLVVDNGSMDGSADIADGLGAQVVHEPRRGFGAACFAGLQAARSEVVCFMDCDGSLDPRDLLRVVEPVLEGQMGMVLGARAAEPGAWPVHARLANRLLTWELARRTDLRLRDLGPMRAAPRTGLLALGIRDRRFGWPLEMVLRAAAAGWQIEETEVRYLPRGGGRSKVTGTLRGTAQTVRDMSLALR